MKTEPLPSPKSSTKPITKVTRQFFSANSPCWLRNSQQKPVRCRLKNHHLNTFQRWGVDSEVLAAPIHSEKFNENWVGVDWKIINQTTSKGDAWIPQRAQPLLTLKKSMKTEPLPSSKSSTKLIRKVTCGFVSAHSPCWIRNSQHQLSRYRLRNHHRNTFQRWRENSEALATPLDLEKVNENWVSAD
jgi:hypothetical protein